MSLVGQSSQHHAELASSSGRGAKGGVKEKRRKKENDALEKLRKAIITSQEVPRCKEWGTYSEDQVTGKSNERRFTDARNGVSLQEKETP